MLLFPAMMAEAQFQRDTNPAPDPRGKAAWEWMASERAQARRDLDRRRERIAAFAAKHASQSSAMAARPRLADIIDGGRNPELFFTGELFEHLVRSAFVTLPDGYPQIVRDRSSDLFRNGADWERFAAIASDYAAVIRQERQAARALDAQGVEALQNDKCIAAARALREARRTFGRARFDRMLYETVAVSMVQTFSADTDFELSINSARQREERCQ